MAISGNQRAITTARFGAARFGASRFGWVPLFTAGALYIWRQVVRATTTWTKVR